METSPGVFVGIDPFEVIVRSEKLEDRPCQCPAHLAVPNDEQDGQVSADEPSNNDTSLLDEVFMKDPPTTGSEGRAATTTTTAISTPESVLKTTACRVEDARVCVEHNHFINGTNMTPSVVQGQPLLCTLHGKDHPMPRWSKYGISWIEPEASDDSEAVNNKIWLHFHSNRLAPHSQHLDRAVLRYIILDFYWVSSSPDILQSQLFQHNLNTLMTTHSLETMGMMAGLNRTLVQFSVNHPLIFSPKWINRFYGMMRDYCACASSALAVYRRSTSAQAKALMTENIQGIREQYPSVSSDDLPLLLETSVESLSNRLILEDASGKPTLDTTPTIVVDNLDDDVLSPWVEDIIDMSEPSRQRQQQRTNEEQQEGYGICPTLPGGLGVRGGGREGEGEGSEPDLLSSSYFDSADEDEESYSMNVPSVVVFDIAAAAAAQYEVYDGPEMDMDTDTDGDSWSSVESGFSKFFDASEEEQDDELDYGAENGL
ncbi:hypothetical protein BGX23_006667 [Mortierella sp. AD031]|nr:hypothetical protein BGX23_006667 [Mortierella sp. AD031]